jgi:hypothetical protein
MTPEQLRDAARQSNSVLRDLGPDIQWVHRYVTGDKHCVYHAPTEALSAPTRRNRASRPARSRR